MGVTTSEVDPFGDAGELATNSLWRFLGTSTWSFGTSMFASVSSTLHSPPSLYSGIIVPKRIATRAHVSNDVCICVLKNDVTDCSDNHGDGKQHQTITTDLNPKPSSYSGPRGNHFTHRVYAVVSSEVLVGTKLFCSLQERGEPTVFPAMLLLINLCLL